MNRTWYAVKNFLLAGGSLVLAGIAGPIVGASAQIVMYILGAYFIFIGISSFPNGGFRSMIPIAGIGVAAIALADYLAKSFEAFNVVCGCISAAVLAFIAFTQYGKTKDRYGRDSKYRILMKILPYVYPTALILGAVCMLLCMFPSLTANFPSFLNATGLDGTMKTLFGIGTVGWILYTIYVLHATKSTGMASSRSARGAKSSASTGARSYSDIDDVRKAMNSVASQFSGGIEPVGSGVNLYFGTSVSVSDGSIVFKVNGDLRGKENIKSQSDADAVTHNIPRVVQARQKRIMESASNRLDGMALDRDYSLNVEVGELTE